jgi:hypothetical protein
LATLTVGDAFCELVDIGAQACFLLGADGAIFGDALLAAAEHVSLLICSLGFDLNQGLLLPGVERGRLSQHRGDVVRVMTRTVGRLADAIGRRIEGFHNRTRAARRRMQEIHRLTPSARKSQ